MNFTPGTSVATAATRYTEAVKQKIWQERTQVPPDNADRIAASRYQCPSSPAPSGPLTRHSFARNSTTCAFCAETPAWILADPNQELTPQ